MTTIIDDLGEVYAGGQVPYVEYRNNDIEHGNNGPIVRQMGLWSRFTHWHDKAFHEKRLEKLAEEVTKVLAVRERALPLDKGTADSQMDVAELLKNEIKAYKADKLAAAEQLTKEILAIRMGVATKVFNVPANDGFQKFAAEYALYQYVGYHGHVVRVDESTQEISLMKEGKYVPWSQMKDEVRTYYADKSKMRWQSVYGQNGVTNKDSCVWTELEAYKMIENPSWGQKYMFSFRAYKNARSQYFRNHSGLRLLTPEGKIYSVGLYDDVKAARTDFSLSFQGLCHALWNLRETLDKINSILMTTRGFLMSPDVCEYWPYSVADYSVEITEDEFKSIKASIEADKLAENLVFQQFYSICVQYVHEKAAIAGKNFDSSTTTSEILVPERIYKPLNAFMKLMPERVQRVCSYIMGVFWNCIQLLLGSNRWDSKLEERHLVNAKKHFPTIFSILDHTKSNIWHPWILHRHLEERSRAQQS